jgi:Holliday junction resolvase
MLRIDMNEWRLFLTYGKGVAAEQQLVRWLKDRGYETQRAAGSRGAADILAAKKGLLGFGQKKYAIQVKSTSEDKYRIAKKEIEELSEFADKFDSNAVLAIRFLGEKWRFRTGGGEDWEAKSPLYRLLDEKEPYVLLKTNGKEAELFEQAF